MYQAPALQRTCVTKKAFVSVNGRNVNTEWHTVYMHPRLASVAKDPRVVFVISWKVLLQADITDVILAIIQVCHTLSPCLPPISSRLALRRLPLSLIYRLFLIFLLSVSYFLFSLLFSLISLLLVSCVSLPFSFPFLATFFAFPPAA